MAKLGILLVEDHRVVREGLRALLDTQPDMEVLGEAGDGREAMRLLTQNRPALAVVDVGLPGLKGARVVQEMMAADPELRCLALSAHEEPSYLREMFAAGARGYALKRSAGQELLRAIRVVATGGTYLDPGFPPEVVQGLFRRPSHDESARAQLTPREEEVVRLIGLGHSNKEIAQRLEVSVKTVETHKARSLEKLQITSRAGIVRYALERGWLRDA
ncbi:MAG: response regulator [Gemmatimonadales bacterium]